MGAINLKLFEKTVLWYEIFSSQNPDFKTSLDELEENEIGGKGAIVSLINNFDYATLPNNEWHFYSYITVHLPNVVSVTAAVQYKFFSDDFNWDQFFTVEVFKPAFVNAVENAVMLFHDFCLKNALEADAEFTKEGFMPDDKLINGICEDTIDIYFNNRKLNDIANYPAQIEIQLSSPYCKETYITLTLTFIVLSEILFFNSEFNRKHNREEFFKKVPEMKFYSLWTKCSRMAKQDVELTVMDTSLFLICVDCAMQMVLGDKADLLIPLLEQKGVTGDVQKIWFKSSTALFNAFCKNGTDPLNGEEKIDWNKLIL